MGGRVPVLHRVAPGAHPGRLSSVTEFSPVVVIENSQHPSRKDARMAHWGTGREAGLGEGAQRYERHRPEQTLLYQLVEQYYPAFVAELAVQGRPVPAYVQRQFEEYLKCGRFEQGFLRVRCEACHRECLAAGDAGSVRAVGRGAGWRAPPCWSTTSCPRCRSASNGMVSVPYALRFLFATRPAVMGEVLGIVYRVIATHLVQTEADGPALQRS